MHLSEQEKAKLIDVLHQIGDECNSNIDVFTSELLISHIELFLNYCKRFYGRQFITRTNHNKDVIARFESFLTDYINSETIQVQGIPSVKYCAEKMYLSPGYFSDLLKTETGKNAQEHIHFFILEKAKTMLVYDNKTVNEIAYELGFQYPQNFTKLFKKKVGISPTMYRAG